MNVLTLDSKGVFLAFVIAFVMLLVSSLGFGGIYLGFFFVLSMLYFLFLSAVVTRTGIAYKKKIKQYQTVRGIWNVVANGSGPLLFVALCALTSGGIQIAAVAGFIGSVAAVTADKFSSEIGIMNGTPTSIATFRKIRKGESGGITLLGLSAGLFGAFVVAAVLSVGYTAWFFPLGIFNSGACAGLCAGYSVLLYGMLLSIIAVATIAGLIGTISDSVLGHWEEKGYGNKYTSNFFCSIIGGLVAFSLLILL